MTIKLLVFSALAVTTVAFPVQAAVVSGMVTGGTALAQGGVFTELAVPFIAPATGDSSVGRDTFQTPNLYAFNEAVKVIVPSEIKVNIGTNLSAGDIVDSHYVFFDPLSYTTIKGYVDFGAAILGVATSTAFLSASDFLANDAVTYLNPNARGLEAPDSVAIDLTNPNRLLINFRASSPGDYVRIFTTGRTGEDPGLQPIPVPAAGWLSLGGIGLLAALRRRKSRSSAGVTRAAA